MCLASLRFTATRLFAVLFISTLPLGAIAQGSLLGEGPATAAVEDTETPIDVGADRVDDAVIQQRIAELFANIDALHGTQSTVTAGVVKLSGSLASKQAREQALRLVQRIDGVVAVNDQLEIDRSITKRINSVTGSLTDRLFEMVALAPLLLIAVGLFVLFWVLSGFLVRWDALFERITPNPFLKSLLKQMVRGVFFLAGFIVLLEILDATALLGAILGAAGILGLAIGFAIRDTVENYLASILLSLRQPFDANDQVEIEGHEGLVLRLTSRETVLMTLDGNHVRIPNATVYKSILVNYSRNPNRRFSFEVGVDTAVSLNAARALGVNSLLGTPGVLADPPPSSRITQLGDSNVVLLMLGWVNQNENDFHKVRSEAIRAVKKAFDAANYEMPEPIYRVKLEGALSGSGLDGTSANTSSTEASPNPGTRPAEDSEPAPDVGREHFIERQIEAERRTQGDEEDLLADD